MNYRSELCVNEWLTGAPIAQARSALRPLSDSVDCTPLNLDELDGLLPQDRVFRDAGVLVGLVPRSSGWQLLLTRRTETLANHAGQISFPGGRVEASDAGVVAAALRETTEETGIERSAMAPVGLLDRYATISAFNVTPVLALVHPEATYRHDPAEVDEVFEVPLAHVLDRANLVREERFFMGRMRGYYVIWYQHYRIWGATAGMLVNLIERFERHGLKPTDFSRRVEP